MASKMTTSKRTVFLGCFLGATIVLLVPHSLTSRCQYGFRRIFCVPLGISRSLTLAAKAPATPEISGKAHLELKEAFQELENHADNLTAMLAQQEQTIDRLSRIRIEPEWQKLCFVPANVFTALGDDHVVINRGLRDSVQSKYFILADNAIVGQITEANQHQATVKLISDSGAFLGVYIDTPDTRGILRGLGQGRCAIRNVGYARPVKIGQSVYTTSSQQDLLGISIVVGRVSACYRDEQAPHLWMIEMTPAAALDELHQVDVILPGQPESIL